MMRNRLLNYKVKRTKKVPMKDCNTETASVVKIERSKMNSRYRPWELHVIGGRERTIMNNNKHEFRFYL